MAKREAATSEELKIATYEKESEEQAAEYVRVAKKIEGVKPIEAAALYAEASRKSDKYEKYLDKADEIGAKLAKKGDRIGAAQVAAYISQDRAEEYGDTMAEKEKYAEAGLAYFLSGNYKKAEQMINYANKSGNKIGAMKVLRQFVMKELKEAGIAGQYEQKQEQREAA